MEIQSSPPNEENKTGMKKRIKSDYMVKLVKFDPLKKHELKHEISDILKGLTLSQVIKFMESSPRVLKSDLQKEEAETIKTNLEKVGATVIIM